MSLSREDREEVAQLLRGNNATVMRALKAQHRESMRLCLLLLEAILTLGANLYPVGLALAKRGVLSDEDLRTAETELAADLATHPKARAFWRAADELKRLAEELDRESQSDTT
jgi:hypothetical protein